MLKRTLLLILILTVSCQAQTEKKYADKLKGCLTDSDVEILNKATFFFEQKLAEHYGNADNNKNFTAYLAELGTIQSRQSIPNFTKDFYLNDNSIGIMRELKENGTFKKIWVQFAENSQEQEDEVPIAVAPEYKEPEKEKFKLYILNPTGDYLNCVNKKSNNKAIKEILNSQTKYGNIAPNIIAAALSESIKEKDFENGLNKVIIAVGLYYSIVNLLNENLK